NNNNYTNNYSLHHIYKKLPLFAITSLCTNYRVQHICYPRILVSFAVLASLCETFKTDYYSYFQQ
ncbi:hypothetical protein L873DRAFT_1801656, partial [Choiromyces venosus 120613-1]